MSYKRGKNGENRACVFLEEVEGVEAKRNLAERRSGEKGDLITNIPCEFEVKSQKQPSVWKALEQVKESVEKNGNQDLGVAMVERKNGPGKKRDRFVAMSWEDFREIIEALKAEGVW